MNKTIVVEFGSKYIRGGYAGESSPRFVLESDGILDIDDSQSLVYKLIDLFQRIFIEKLVIKAKECSVIVLEKLSFKRTFRNHLFTVLLKDFQVHDYLQ